MKRKVLIIILILFFVSGCSDNKLEFSKEINTVRDNIEMNLLKKSKDNVVVKYIDDDGLTNYYLYQIFNGGYREYLYVFHENEEEYKEYLNKYSELHYNLYEYDDAYVTKITLSTIKNSSEKDIKTIIKNKYKDKKYTIVE